MGTVLLVPNTGIAAHRADVQRLMVRRTCRDVVSARSCSERPSPTPVRRAWRC